MKRIYSVLAVLLLLCTTAFAQEKTDSLGRAEEAVQTMKIASPEDLIARATIAYEQGNYAQTIADYESLVAAFGSSPELYYNLGNAYFKNKEFAKAILNYERCLIYDPANGDAVANLEDAEEDVLRLDGVASQFLRLSAGESEDLLRAWGQVVLIVFEFGHGGTCRVVWWVGYEGGGCGPEWPSCASPRAGGMQGGRRGGLAEEREFLGRGVVAASEEGVDDLGACGLV